MTIDITKDCDVSLWLIPGDDQLKQYTAVIQDAAHVFHSYSFIPHITLYYFGSCQPKKVIPIIDDILGAYSSIKLPFVDICSSDVFTKTLYIQYKKTQQIINLHQQLYAKCSSFYDYTLSPHMSLLYSTTAEEREKDLFKKQIVLRDEVDLTQCVLIGKSGGIIQTEKDILDWSSIKQWQLR